jgi:heat shock protein HslJ/membrane-bound inhibitor of C-type lysozyme
MKRLELAFFLLLAAAPVSAQHASPTAPATPAPGQPPATEVMYECPGSTDFSVSFSKDGELAVLNVPGSPEIELSRQPSGSGFAYGDSYYELRGRGREATLTAAGRSIRCHAVGRPGEPARTYRGGGLTVTLLPDGTYRLREDTGSGQPVLDLGQWGEEVDGGMRLVLRGGSTPRRTFREASSDRLITDKGVELARQAEPETIDGPFQLTGLYRDTQSGGLFAECRTGRTFALAPSDAEAELERAWTNATPSREAQLYVEIIGRFASDELKVERFLSLNRNGACPSPAPRGSALVDTEWRVIEVDGARPVYEDWRQRPRLRLDDDGRYAGSTGCNTIAGSYVLNVDGLRFTPVAESLMACPPNLAQAERRFLDALMAVRQAHIAGTTLDLVDETGKRRLRLEARGR